MNSITIKGILELDCFQKSDGENVCAVDIRTSESKKLYNLLGEFDQEKVKITVERIDWLHIRKTICNKNRAALMGGPFNF